MVSCAPPSMTGPFTTSADGADLLCHRCARMLHRGEGSFYIVRIEAVADPTPPVIDGDESATDFATEWERLLDEIRGLSEQELMDQVHRRLTLLLCAPCYRDWIEAPTG
jgi:hypothetical protein